MSVILTDRLLADIGLQIAETVAQCGYASCKVMTTFAGASELECCDCDSGEGMAVTVWEERSYPSVFPPLPVEPEPGSSAWVDVHEIHFTIATCWPAFDRVVPTENDPREDTAVALLKVRDCVTAWLSSCSRNVERLTTDPNLKAWNRGARAERALHSEAGMECRGWEWTLLVW